MRTSGKQKQGNIAIINKQKFMWIYLESEPGLFTVGFYDPKGNFQGDSDHNTREEAAARVHYLNGGKDLLQ